MKLNKGTILKASCDYIRLLQKDRDSVSRMAQQQSKIEDTARQYMDRIKVRDKIIGLNRTFSLQELEQQLAQNGIPVKEKPLPPLPIPIGRPIKQEPVDETPNHTPTEIVRHHLSQSE